MTAMERPVYYIKGVVRDGAEATQDFVGPLDLILHLLQKNRIAVRDIPLAGILAQFLTWMSSRRALDLEVAGEFISMASHLMLLKTRMLLPSLFARLDGRKPKLFQRFSALPTASSISSARRFRSAAEYLP